MATKQTTDVKELNKLLRKAGEDMKHAHAVALLEKGYQIDADAARDVPWKTGRLSGTHRVAHPQSIENPFVYMYYGTTYALPVHERFRPWLRNAMEKHQPTLASWLVRRTRDNFRQGRKLKGV